MGPRHLVGPSPSDGGSTPESSVGLPRALWSKSPGGDSDDSQCHDDWDATPLDSPQAAGGEVPLVGATVELLDGN
eukprot:1416421-Rhodomonas_salina.1